VDRLDRLQRDVHGAVHGRSCLGQNAGYAERLVVVIGKAPAHAMAHDDGIADLVVQRLGHIGTDHCIEQVVERPALGKGFRSSERRGSHSFSRGIAAGSAAIGLWT
jgi:hypothetical protein